MFILISSWWAFIYPAQSGQDRKEGWESEKEGVNHGETKRQVDKRGNGNKRAPSGSLTAEGLQRDLFRALLFCWNKWIKQANFWVHTLVWFARRLRDLVSSEVNTLHLCAASTASLSCSMHSWEGSHFLKVIPWYLLIAVSYLTSSTPLHHPGEI